MTKTDISKTLTDRAERTAALATQRGRALQRDGNHEDVERRIAGQMPLADKARLADCVVDNSGDRAATLAEVRRVHRALLADLRARQKTGR